MTVTDFFARRASVFYWTHDGGLGVAEAVAAEMGRMLNWSEPERQRQLADYRSWVTANRFEPLAVQNVIV